MSSTSAAERAATSGPKAAAAAAAADDDNNSMSQESLASTFASRPSDPSILDRLCNHFRYQDIPKERSYIHLHLLRHSGREDTFLLAAICINESDNFPATCHIKAADQFLNLYPAGNEIALIKHIRTGNADLNPPSPLPPQPRPQEQASPVPCIVTTTKKKDPHYSSSLAAAAAATATEEMSMPPPQDRTPSKQLNSNFGEAGYWNQKMNGAVQIVEDIDPSPTTQAGDTGMLDMQDRAKANLEKQTSRKKTLKGGKKLGLLQVLRKKNKKTGGLLHLLSQVTKAAEEAREAHLVYIDNKERRKTTGSF